MLALYAGSNFSSLVMLFGYKNFNNDKHYNLVTKWSRKATLPTIDVFLPTAGEDLKILKRTYNAVQILEYDKSKLNIYVLDDSGREEVKELAGVYGYNYLSRPNKGEMKKAGNLKYGYENSNGEFIIIFDADFAPRTDFIKHLLPYHLEDKTTGIVQSPQTFVTNPDEDATLQEADAIIQSYFYKLVQLARNSFNASICVGTNAIYRREALEKAGGFYQIEHSEDSHTGFNLRTAGYKIKYIPLLLAFGYCPSTFLSFFKQRSRWCQGSLSMATSKLFWEHKMSVMARLSYLSGFFYYVSSFIILALPFNILYVLYEKNGTTNDTYMWFLPNIAFLVLGFTFYFFSKFKFSLLGTLFYFYWVYAYIICKKFIFKRNEEWTPTGTLANATNGSYSGLLTVIFLYISTFWGLVTYYVINYSHLIKFDLPTFAIWFWVIFNMLQHISFIKLYLFNNKK
jgi:cellulose synthase (UDP-forming)